MQIRIFSLFFYFRSAQLANARAFDELRTHLVTVGRTDQMRSAFGQTRSAIGQMRAHLTNFVRILSLLVGLTKCAAHLGKRAVQLAKCARAFSQSRARLANRNRARFAKCARDLPNVAQLVKFRAFD